MIGKNLHLVPTSLEIAYFIELYSTKHITKSSIRLGITQPTLTLALKNLEKKLDIKLFYRTKQGIIPTKSAHLLYHEAQNLNECWSYILAKTHALEHEIKGLFKIGCHPSVGAYTLPILLHNIQKNSPNIEIKLVHDTSRKITEKVISYEIDFGYVVNPYKHSDLVLKKIGTDTVQFWKSKNITKTPEIIFCYEGSTQADVLLNQVLKKHCQNWQVVESTNMELIKTLTEQGLGICLLPTRVVHSTQSNLTLVNDKYPKGNDEIYLAYRKEVLASRAGKEILKHASILLDKI